MQYSHSRTYSYVGQPGLLAGYRFQSNSSSAAVVTKNVSRTGDHTQTIVFAAVSYEPLEDSMFEFPQAVKALLKPVNR